MKRMRIVGVGAAALVLVAACGGGDGRSASDTTATTAGRGGSATTSSIAASSVARGEQLVAHHNCLSCHSTTGRRLVGPTWKELAGSTVELSNGQTVIADHDYLARSILEPDAQVVEGFSSGIMSALIKPGSISRDEADAIIRYIESLS